MHWAIVLAIFSLITIIILNTFFLYIPVSKIEKDVDNIKSTVVSTAEKIEADLPEVNKKINQILDLLRGVGS